MFVKSPSIIHTLAPQSSLGLGFPHGTHKQPKTVQLLPKQNALCCKSHVETPSSLTDFTTPFCPGVIESHFGKWHAFKLFNGFSPIFFPGVDTELMFSVGCPCYPPSGWIETFRVFYSQLFCFWQLAIYMHL